MSCQTAERFLGFMSATYVWTFLPYHQIKNLPTHSKPMKYSAYTLLVRCWHMHILPCHVSALPGRSPTGCLLACDVRSQGPRCSKKKLSQRRNTKQHSSCLSCLLLSFTLSTSFNFPNWSTVHVQFTFVITTYHVFSGFAFVHFAYSVYFCIMLFYFAQGNNMASAVVSFSRCRCSRRFCLN